MHLINGQWIEGTGAEFHSINPANGDIIWSAKSAEIVQVEAAVTAARSAFAAWSTSEFEQRVAILSRFRDLLEDNKQNLSQAISEETGKIGWDADSEVAAAIGKLKFSLAAYEERTPSKSIAMGPVTAQLRHRPHGVMAVYGPYNFPLHLPGGHIIPALLAGNSIVFKPSEQTPMVAELTVKLWQQSGLPDGVLNLVQGEKDTGIALANADINGLLFTGSSPTGKLLHKQFAGRPEVLLALELGGNNGMIINEIDHIDAAVHEIILSAFISTGQRCTCARRLILTDAVDHDRLLARLVEVASTLTIGTYKDTKAPFMGPLVSNNEANRLLTAYDALVDSGGTPLLPMRRLDDKNPFISAGIVDITPLKKRPDEEWFGPLLQVIRVATLDDAIDELNATQYGLSAGLLCKNKQSFDLMLQKARAGIINWNKQTTGASGMAPFGGIGCSGNHHPAGYYAADYCAHPVASMAQPTLTLPESLPPGFTL